MSHGTKNDERVRECESSRKKNGKGFKVGWRWVFQCWEGRHAIGSALKVLHNTSGATFQASSKCLFRYLLGTSLA